MGGHSVSESTVGFHNSNLRIVNLRFSNRNKLIVDVFLTRCRISMCQGLGPKKHDEISEIDRRGPGFDPGWLLNGQGEVSRRGARSGSKSEKLARSFETRTADKQQASKLQGPSNGDKSRRAGVALDGARGPYCGTAQAVSYSLRDPVIRMLRDLPMCFL